jgi:hypothetical protein
MKLIMMHYVFYLMLIFFIYHLQLSNSIIITINKDVLQKINKHNLYLHIHLEQQKTHITIPPNINRVKYLSNKIIYEKYKMAPRKTIKTKNNKNNNKTRKRNKKKSKKGRDSKISKQIIKIANKMKTTDTCSINSDGLGFTCYSKPVLYKIKDTWNKKHPEHKITSQDPYIIWKSLRSVMEHEHACKRESCWLKHLCIKEGLPSNIYDLTFSPEMPESWLKNPNEWLSSLDIVKVMNQWEQRYKCFKFIGPSPIDYDTHKMFGECVWDELCKFNLKSHIKNKKKKVGIIFNLDPHYKSGSHWVAVFINDVKKTIYYFDSYGDRPHPQIKKFIDSVINQSTQLGTTYKYLENKKRHQFGNSECGMYSMYFITQMLQNKCFEKFQRKVVSDAYMLRLRKKFFNKPV